jgi:prepilin-type N-terminal cleavage/methylation domain-containing protein
MQRDKRVKKGFTLLEILLVIAAIGILAAIVLVAINPTKQIAQVRTAAINSEKNTIEKAITQRFIDTGTYPTVIDGVQRRICSSTVTTNCINITADIVPTYIAAIPTGAIYTASKNNDERININMAETLPSFRTCPTGYIRVPGNNLYQTKDFCVMKYEAKAGSATVAATTQAVGTPVVSINQSDADQACTNNGAGYGLITNAEWMTVARNIEAQNSNWYNPTPTPVNQVGSGGLNRGHTNTGPGSALAASINDLEGCVGYTDGRTCTNQWHVNRRTHTLSNGESIWDMGGNVWEWTNDSILGKDQPTRSPGGWNYREYRTGLSNSITNFGTLSRDLVGPGNSVWGSGQNMGQIYSDGTSDNTTSYGFLRSGDWNDDLVAGVFAFALSNTPISTNTGIGFRCILR